MTFLQIVNRVLRRLREDEVTDLSDSYSKLIAEFVRAAHEEVLADHDWSVFDYSITVPMVAGEPTYLIDETTLNNGYTSQVTWPITKDSMLRYVNGNEPLVYWYDSPSSRSGDQLIQISWPEFVKLLNEDGSQTTPSPSCFALAQWDQGWELCVWPAPSASSGEVRMLWHQPEPAIDVETDALSRVIRVPWRPVVLGAVYLALNERGEELGEPGNIAEQRYYSALAAAKESDILNSGRVNRYEAYRD